MNLLILSQRKNLYSTRRLVETALKLGHVAHVFDPLNLLLVLRKRTPAIFHKNLSQQIPEIDVVLPRIGPSITDYDLAVIHQFSMMDIPTLNKS